LKLHERNRLPIFVQELLIDLPPALADKLEEIRIRRGRPVELIVDGRSTWLNQQPVDEAFCRQLLDRLTHYSVYSFEEQLRKGFITMEGGHRVGLCGQVSLQNGAIQLIRDVTSFNIRLARQCHGIADRLMPLLYDAKQQRYVHTLLISPPQQGKTTMLREMARLASGGFATKGQAPQEPFAVDGCKVALVDERSELAGCVKGVPVFDVGPRTDVLDHCPKAEGMMLLIRSMSPQLLIVDELGHEADAQALRDAMLAGVSVFASVHGQSMLEVMERPLLRAIHDLRLFERYVVLQRRGGGNLYMRIYDSQGHGLSTLLEQRS
jgi:stage III sporulation protein AA